MFWTCQVRVRPLYRRLLQLEDKEQFTIDKIMGAALLWSSSRNLAGSKSGGLREGFNLRPLKCTAKVIESSRRLWRRFVVKMFETPGSYYLFFLTAGHNLQVIWCETAWWFFFPTISVRLLFIPPLEFLYFFVCLFIYFYRCIVGARECVVSSRQILLMQQHKQNPGLFVSLLSYFDDAAQEGN